MIELTMMKVNKTRSTIGLTMMKVHKTRTMKVNKDHECAMKGRSKS